MSCLSRSLTRISFCWWRSCPLAPRPFGIQTLADWRFVFHEPTLPTMVETERPFQRFRKIDRPAPFVYSSFCTKERNKQFQVSTTLDRHSSTGDSACLRFLVDKRARGRGTSARARPSRRPGWSCATRPLLSLSPSGWQPPPDHHRCRRRPQPPAIHRIEDSGCLPRRAGGTGRDGARRVLV